MELANGFGELTDPVEQRARLVEAMDEKEKRYGKRWPIDEDFLAALAHMPPASGVALGFDRAGDAGDRRAAHQRRAVDAGMIRDRQRPRDYRRHPPSGAACVRAGR